MAHINIFLDGKYFTTVSDVEFRKVAKAKEFYQKKFPENKVTAKRV